MTNSQPLKQHENIRPIIQLVHCDKATKIGQFFKEDIMKMLTFTFALGVVFLYFINIAIFKTPTPSMEWSIHAGTRFLLGFFVLGIICLYANALKLRSALLLILIIVTLDYIYDYYIEAYRLNFEIILHGIYMVIWGALLGYLTVRSRYNP